MAKGDYVTARSKYQESLAICHRCGSTRDMAWTLTNLADVAREESQFNEAEQLYSRSLGLFRQIDDQGGIANSMADLGNLAGLRQQYVMAAQLYQESLVIFGDLGDRPGIARVLEGFAVMASARGHYEAALRLAGVVRSVRDSLGLQRSRAQRCRVDASIAKSRTALGNEAERIWLEGQRTPLEQAITYALTSATV
jgi:tetratricopeptide (TPR) repeat protein